MATNLRNSVIPGIGIAPSSVLETTTNNRYTVIGLNLANTTTSMVQVNIQLVDSATNAAHTLSGVALTSTSGQFTCTATTLQVGQTVVITGTLTGNAVITGYNNTVKTYYIVATNGSTQFTLSATNGGPVISTTTGTLTGLSFTAGTIDVSAYLLKNIMIAPQSSLKACTNGEKIVLGPSNSLKVSANVNNAIDAVVSFVEIL